MADSTPVAFVTGASRGIGRASAIALAEAGYDVVISARTRQPGEKRDYGASRAELGNPIALPGSLEETAADIEATGRRALPIQLDLLDGASLESAVDQALREWGRIDVLFNNAVYQGPGMMDRFFDIEADDLVRAFEGNFFAQFHLTRRVLAHMCERGSGAIVNMTSHAAQNNPPTKPDEGSWGFGYAASKAAFHRMAGFLHIEFNDRGITAYNIDPGYVPTESQLARGGKDDPIYQRHIAFGAPPEVPASMLVWLVTSEEARARSGETFLAPKFVARHGLLPGWPPPRKGSDTVGTDVAEE